MSYGLYEAGADATALARAECDEIDALSTDFRDLVMMHCPRCAGTGEECIMMKINEVAFAPDGSA